MAYKNYIFDMDGTLTNSRSRMGEKMTASFRLLCRKHRVVVISGAKMSQITKQIGYLNNITMMAQSGNYCEGLYNKELWNRKLTIYQRMKIYSHINNVLETFPISVRKPNDLIQDRGCQISFSLIGHNEDKAIKSSFDDGGGLRKNILEFLPFKEDGLTVRVGGTTCLDYIASDGTKADNLKRLLSAKGLSKSVYIGDQLYEGGNDYDVMKIKGLKCIPVNSPKETLEFIKQELSREGMGDYDITNR